MHLAPAQRLLRQPPQGLGPARQVRHLPPPVTKALQELPLNARSIRIDDALAVPMVMIVDAGNVIVFEGSELQTMD
jgi:hypothetical protein